jgi:hypothetical protein
MRDILYLLSVANVLAGAHAANHGSYYAAVWFASAAFVTFANARKA